ncbi:hypothetical protein LZC95_14120 [Pendulispora brunnea]|uniref:Glycosyltransferase RgtA/B/C/D-like domain-containing protein n=1 Tax=Pendulispora brunnea TaxID=2905690 RepID=A0ABZ2KH20_9BACT
MITSSGSFEVSEGLQRYQTTVSWIRGSGGDLREVGGPTAGVIGSDGRRFSFYGPLQSVVMLPVVIVPQAIAPPAGDKIAKLTMALVVTPALSAFTLVLLFALLRRLQFSPKIALLTTAVLALCTPLWHYSRTGQEENLIALAWVVIMHGLLRIHSNDPRGLLWAAAGATIAVATRWSVAPVLAALGVAVLAEWVYAARITTLADWMQVGRRMRRWRRYLGPSVLLLGIVASLLLTYNWYRFEDPLETGYGIFFRESHIPFFVPDDAPRNAAALLVSPHRGLLWFCPAILMLGWLVKAPLDGFVRRLTWYALAAWCTSLLFFASYSSWDGGFAWGPRFLVSDLVLLAPAFASLFARGVRFYPLLAVSGFVQLLSVMESSSAENYRFSVMNAAQPGACTPWVCGCTPVCLRLPWVLRSLASVWNGTTFPMLDEGRPATNVEVLASSDYNTVYWWLVRIGARTHVVSPRLALFVSVLVLCGALVYLVRIYRQAEE